MGHSVGAGTLCLVPPQPCSPNPLACLARVCSQTVRVWGAKTAGSSGRRSVPGGCSPAPAWQRVLGLSCLVSVSLCCTDLPEPLLAPCYNKVPFLWPHPLR